MSQIACKLSTEADIIYFYKLSIKDEFDKSTKEINNFNLPAGNSLIAKNKLLPSKVGAKNTLTETTNTGPSETNTTIKSTEKINTDLQINQETGRSPKVDDKLPQEDEFFKQVHAILQFKQSVALENKYNLRETINKSCFSIILNKHLSTHNKIFMSLVIIYFSNDKMHSYLYRLIAVNSENFLNDIVNQMERDGFDMKKLVGCGIEVTQFKNCNIETVLLNLKEKKDIIINKYMHHPVGVLVGDTYKHIFENVAILLKETYNWFKWHNGQTNNDNLQRTILESVSEDTDADDMWIFKLDLINAVINNWVQLKKYFKHINNTYGRWPIHSLYGNTNERYLKLLQRSFMPIKNFVEFLNSPDVTQDRMNQELEKISKCLKAIAADEAAISHQQYKKYENKFLTDLEYTINNLKLINKNYSAPLAVPISNEKIEKIVSFINQLLNNLKDDFSEDNLELLEIFIQMKFSNKSE